MGSAAATENGLAAPDLRVFRTPREDVDITARLALASCLCSHPITLPTALLDRVLGRDFSPSAHRQYHRVTTQRWQEAAGLLTRLTVLDPACGEGDFLLGMLDLLDETGEYVQQQTGHSEDRASRRRRIGETNLYGIEVQPGPLARAAVALRSASGSDLGVPLPNLMCADSLLTSTRGRHMFPGVAARGGFDIVIGNPPYLRHERIADPRGRMTPDRYKRRLFSEIDQRLPLVFGHEESTMAAPAPLDGRSDLCVHFLLHGLSLLRDGGTLGFVMPAGLFQAGYGSILERLTIDAGWRGFALDRELLRSFAGAGINTAILALARHDSLPSLRTAPIASGMSTLWQSTAVRDQKTARPVSKRRPQPPTVLPLGTLGRLRYPLKTGLNAFFYPSARMLAGMKIEPEFLQPLLKSPRDVQRIALDAGTLRSAVFICDRSMDELRQSGAEGALAYISWGATRQTTDGLPWPVVPSGRWRTPWYSLSVPAPAHILCPRFFDRRYFFAVPQGPMIEDQTFYGLVLDDHFLKYREIIAALLNSSWTYLELERAGRTGLGDGVRQYALKDMSNLPVLDPRTMAAALTPDLIRQYRRVAGRPILPIQDEVRQADRIALDAIVAEMAGVRERDMAAVRDEIVHRQGARRQRAHSVMPPPD